MNKMTLQEALDYIHENDNLCVRGDDFIPESQFNNSFYHGDDEEYELPGVSAIRTDSYEDDDNLIKRICQARGYGDNVFLLKADCTNADEVTGDPNEVLMVSHEIVAIIDAQFIRKMFAGYVIS